MLVCHLWWMVHEIKCIRQMYLNVLLTDILLWNTQSVINTWLCYVSYNVNYMSTVQQHNFVIKVNYTNWRNWILENLLRCFSFCLQKDMWNARKTVKTPIIEDLSIIKQNLEGAATDMQRYLFIAKQSENE